MNNEIVSYKFLESSKTLSLKSLVILFFTFSCLFGYTQSIGRTKDGFHIINVKGQITTEKYDFIQIAGYNIFLASQNGKFGYLNNDGSIAIPLIYDVAYPFHGDFALVGNAGMYYHINKANKVLDSIDWPKAPLVYNQHLLLSNENENKVFFEDGTELLKSSYQLTLASKGGIIEWNAQKDSVFQYTSPYGNKELKLVNSFSVIGALSFTNQGYLCIPQLKEGKEIYSVYDQFGEQLISCDKEGVDPNLIQVVWNNFVYIPMGNPIYRTNEIGLETHFPMSELWIKGQNQLSPFTFQLCNTYADDEMILLKYSDKWLPFNGRDIEGNYLFDDIVQGDEHFTPVKMGRKWFLLDRRQDSLIPLPYKKIHPIGMNKGRFFASTKDYTSINEEKWAFINYQLKTATEEIYKVPLLPESDLVFDKKERYNWGIQYNEVIKDEKRIILDYRGNELWTDPPGPAITIEDFFKVNFAFKFDNFKDLPKKHPYKKNQIAMVIEPIASGIYVQLTNTKKKGAYVDIQDGYFQAILEMKTNDGSWLKIGFLDPSWCGNSYYGDYIPSKKMATTIVNFPKGDQPITIRAILNEHSENRVVSNEIQIKTNGARLWVDKYCSGFGCTTKD